jgi:hypothetical protein
MIIFALNILIFNHVKLTLHKFNDTIIGNIKTYILKGTKLCIN